jgi:hypothetical protein
MPDKTKAWRAAWLCWQFLATTGPVTSTIVSKKPGLDLLVDHTFKVDETIMVKGHKSHYQQAPIIGHDEHEPNSSSIVDPCGGAEVGEFGLAYVLASHC